MMPAIPSTMNNASLVGGTTFTTRKSNISARFCFSRKSKNVILTSQKFLFPLSTSLRLFPQCSWICSLHHNSRNSKLPAATGTDVVVDEPESPTSSEDSAEGSEVPSNAGVESEKFEQSPIKSDANNPTPAQTKRSRPVRKSEMPPVKNEELVPGATFTGKVRSIQPFGAFIDFGAFTDGLVHVSRLSDSYVKDVASVVSVGQEVKVRLLEVNNESGRISLSMRENEDTSKPQQRKDSPSSVNKAATSRRSSQKSQRRDEGRKSSKFVKGQDLEGTVKNLTRAGAFISLPEGEEGFLPSSEESDGGFANIMGGSSLEVGQEVSVRVLRVSRGQVTLTMKKEEDNDALDSKLSQGVVHVATNPFVVAFRKNKDISSFLDEKAKVEEEAKKTLVEKISEIVESTVDKSQTISSDSPKLPDEQISSDEGKDSALPILDETAKEEEASSNDETLDARAVDNASTNILTADNEPESIHSFEKIVDGGAEIIDKEEQDTKPSEENVSAANQTIKEAEPEENNQVLQELVTAQESDVTEEEVKIQMPDEENKVLSSDPAQKEEVEPVSDKDGSVVSSGGLESDGNSDLSKDSSGDQIQSSERQTIEGVENLVDNIKDEVPVKDEKAELVPENNESAPNSNGQSNSPSLDEIVPKATISPALVKQLREETGAGMMDCKKALSETGGNIVKAQEFLRKKGLASADKKASRATAEGRIGSYIHDGRIGVLLEVNCETDFVSRGDIFKELVDDLSMQVAACPQVQYLVTEDVPEEIVNKEKEIEMQKEDLMSKPEQIRSKIVEGRIRKRLNELALLEQPYIKNDKIVVKDWVKQTIATIGENIKVTRFVRYNLGEGLEKKSQDFVAEVAAQTAAKTEPAPGKEQPVADANETVEKPPAVAVSAALVKQLREDTGAGMMDCKKALSETGGDLQKAQEYLRKKGLSTADKKSSRLAAEGRIGSYIHDSRIGVLTEVNCETDFVGRNQTFKELVDDLAMQVVACPQVQYVSIEDIPESIVKKEKEIEMQREDLQSKPENIREKIVDGRISKRLGELVLLEQPFIKNDAILVKDLVKQTVANLGENIKVRRFVRFTLGETTGDEKPENEA